MRSRTLGRTGRDVSEIGFGAWQVGARLGRGRRGRPRSETLHAAADAGVTFFDTADVYGDGRSERLVGRLLRERPPGSSYATKMGRRLGADGRRTTRPSTSAPGTTARARTSASTRSTSSSCTARRPTSTTTRRSSRTSTRWSRRAGSRAYGVSVETRRGGAEGDRVPERRQRPDHLQPVPAAAGGRVLRRRPRGAASA